MKAAVRRARLDLPAGLALALPVLVGFLMLGPLALAGGGYLPRAWRIAALAFAALALAMLVSPRRLALTRLEWAFSSALVAVAGWTALSTTWSDHPATSLLEAERTALYVLGVTALLLIAEQATVAPLLIGGLSAITGVSAYGLAKYLVEPRTYNPIQETLLFEPLGYANAFGILAAIGLLLAVGLAAGARDRRAAALALAPVVVLAPTIYLTSSRGAGLAAAAGLLVLATLRGWLRGRTAVALGIAALVAVSAFAASSGDTGVAGHLFGENRPHYWKVAWREYESQPLLGTGAGTFDNYWLHYRPVPSFSREAHSLYVESLAELGPFGLALVLGALAIPLLALRRARGPLAATAAAGYVAFLVHAGVDWDWETPAVTLTGLFCGALLLVCARGEQTRALGPRHRTLLALAALAVLVVALVRLETGPVVPFLS
jgi:O-antigen ligase